ncbi:MAG TPA: NAD(P)H-dependent oxidoreductase [Povalibacter sp.]|nr:NAD(P)H-dependent oxidoreductase [Povalibacter sp.]
MGRHVLIIDGHPDPREARLNHALAAAYAHGAQLAGHEVRHIAVGQLKLPLLTCSEEFFDTPPSPAVTAVQQDIRWAEHLVIFYPLWLGSMPAQLKGFFEQVMRPGFAYAQGKGRGLPKKLLKGRSARIVVTMGMPAAFYRHVYRAHSLKSLKRNILAFCGIGPIRDSVIGNVEGNAVGRAAWLRKMEVFGRRAT